MNPTGTSALRRPARLPGEGTAAYEAFVVYFELLGSCSQKAVAARLGKSRALMSRWSTRHQWIERVRAAEAAAASAGRFEHAQPATTLDLIQRANEIDRVLLDETGRRVNDPRELQGRSTDEILHLQIQLSKLTEALAARQKIVDAQRDRYSEIFQHMPDDQLAEFIRNWAEGSPMDPL